MNKAHQLREAEALRVSRDLYTVLNPTQNDIMVSLNIKVSPEEWTIPGAANGKPGEAIVPNYVRIKYVEETLQKIIYIKNDELVKKENQKRADRGQDSMDLHTTQARFESRNLKNLSGKQKELVKLLDGGLYKEYGVSDSKGDKVPVQITPEMSGVLEGKKTPTTPEETPITPEEERRKRLSDNLKKAREVKAAKKRKKDDKS